MTFSLSALPAGRNIALKLAKAGKGWKAAAAVRMPEARGDIREIIGQPVFVPLQKLAIIYGKACTCPAPSRGCQMPKSAQSIESCQGSSVTYGPVSCFSLWSFVRMPIVCLGSAHVWRTDHGNCEQRTAQGAILLPHTGQQH